ncbi:Zinc finger BED domain-containing protein [Melia azedarach]|uniref:Zinc finger BED domain-containing protein n=2 Tax=Melia azedarach TaxID=155640 RepID=A0ACC1YJ09_MELAZ|nr:Zinc finger BED domain-containing protein [Melia azedarach]KAJ4723514.1 Zinc finger BED domain-containing protein [Melia azedarach]
MDISRYSVNNEILETHQHHGQEIIEGREIDGNQGNNVEMNIVMNHQPGVGNSSGSSNRRKKQSKVWEEMTKFTGEEDGRDWARCNHCGRKFDGSSKKGTTHLKNHLERCRRKRNNGGEDAHISMDQTTNLTSAVVNKEKSVIDLLKDCFDEYGEPTECWDPFVLNSRKVEILQIYEEEKKKLCTVLSELSCRVNLIIEDSCGWYVLRVCYIDDSWEPKIKTISFPAAIECEERYHNYQNSVKGLKESCLDLKIDGNICSITINDYWEYIYEHDHEDVTEEINSWFNRRGNNPLPFLGFLFASCTIASLFDNYLTKWLWNKFSGIKKCIDYVNSTTSNMHNFQIAVENAKSKGKKVDNAKSMRKKVSSEYLVLDSFPDFEEALAYKEAFRELEQIDSDFKLRSINLRDEEWDKATAISEHCKELLDTCHHLSYFKDGIPNMYFPKFCDIYMKLLPLRTQFDGKTSTPVEKLVYRLEKYNLVLVIVMVLDPRFKMDIIKLWYNKIYGPDADCHLQKIIDEFTTIYKAYAKVSESESRDATTSYLDAMGRPCTSLHYIFVSHKPSSELERYLNDPKPPSIEKFDVLAWWRAYAPIFPTLARMARDFLALPIYYGHFYAYTSRTIEFGGCIFNCDDLHSDIKPALFCLTALSTDYEK